jgi:hypothetical protein
VYWLDSYDNAGWRAALIYSAHKKPPLDEQELELAGFPLIGSLFAKIDSFFSVSSLSHSGQ